MKSSQKELVARARRAEANATERRPVETWQGSPNEEGEEDGNRTEESVVRYDNDDSAVKCPKILPASNCYEIKDEEEDTKQSKKEVSSMRSLGNSVDEFSPEYQEFIGKLN